MEESLRMQEGKRFLEFLWFKVAQEVVEAAIRVYSLDEGQAAALKRAFLRPNDYVIHAV